MTGHDFNEFASRLRALASTGQAHHARQLRRLADEVQATGVDLGYLRPPPTVEPVGSAMLHALVDARIAMVDPKP